MISPFIQNLGKAKGFSQDEQLILQIALGGIMGNRGGSMGGLGLQSKPQSNAFTSMAMTLATLLITHQVLQKMSISQGLSSGNKINQVSPQTLSLASNVSAMNPINNNGHQSYQSYQGPQKIAPLVPMPLQPAVASLTNPSMNTLSQSQQAVNNLSAMALPTLNKSQKSGPTPLFPSP
jgi:hypothetical protein